MSSETLLARSALWRHGASYFRRIETLIDTDHSTSAIAASEFQSTLHMIDPARYEGMALLLSFCEFLSATA
jgi:hypothetical protein